MIVNSMQTVHYINNQRVIFDETLYGRYKNLIERKPTCETRFENLCRP